jgi:hypothetical protein
MKSDKKKRELPIVQRLNSRKELPWVKKARLFLTGKGKNSAQDWGGNDLSANSQNKKVESIIFDRSDPEYLTSQKSKNIFCQNKNNFRDKCLSSGRDNSSFDENESIFDGFFDDTKTIFTFKQRHQVNINTALASEIKNLDFNNIIDKIQAPSEHHSQENFESPDDQDENFNQNKDVNSIAAGPDAVDNSEIEPDEIEPDEVEPDEVEPDEVEPDEVEPDEVEPDEVEPNSVETNNITECDDESSSLPENFTDGETEGKVQYSDDGNTSEKSVKQLGKDDCSINWQE